MVPFKASLQQWDYLFTPVCGDMKHDGLPEKTGPTWRESPAGVRWLINCLTAL